MWKKMLILAMAAALPAVVLMGDDQKADGTRRHERGWMGVMLSEVPPALAHHLKLEKSGVMVRNVAKDSPADKAGLDRYDVIVAVDKEKVSGDISALVKKISSRGPGETVKLRIVRKASEKTVKLRLAKPMPREKIVLKYDDAGDSPFGRFHLRDGGRMGPGWTVRPFGDGDGLSDELRSFGEGRRQRAETSVKIRVREDGTTTEIDRDKDGKITVRKTRETDDGAKTETRSYESEKQLREKDPAAWKVYRRFNLSMREGGFWSLPPREFGRLHEPLREQMELRRELRRMVEEIMKDLCEDFRRHPRDDDDGRKLSPPNAGVTNCK